MRNPFLVATTLIGILFFSTLPHAATTATTLFTFNIPTTRALTATYGGQCAASAFFFNEIDANFDPDTDGNGARVKPRPTRTQTTEGIDSNFVGITNPSTTNVAYDGLLTNKPSTNNINPGTELSSAEYTQISTDNTSYYANNNAGTTTHPSVRGLFRPVYYQRITDINAFVIGNSVTLQNLEVCGSASGTGSDLNLFIWNYDENKYKSLASSASPGGAPDGKTLTARVNTPAHEYVSEDGNIVILIQGIPDPAGSDFSCLTIDYVDINFTRYATPGDYCQSSTLAPITITNTGNTTINVDANFSSAFTGVDTNLVLKVWMGDGVGCGSDGNGLGGWQADCSVTGITSPVTTTTCKNFNFGNATVGTRLTSSLAAGDTNQLCFSGDFNGFVNAGDHNKDYQIGSEFS